MRVLPYDYRNRMNTGMRFANWNPRETSMADTNAKEGGPKIVEERMKLIVLDEPQLCSAVRQPKRKGGQKWTEHPLRIAEVFCRDGHAIRQVEPIKLSRTTNMATAILFMEHSFLFVMNAVMKYTAKFELQYRVSFTEAGTRDIVDDMLPSQYLPKQACPLYIRYVKFDRLVTNNAEVLPRLKLLIESQFIAKELEVTHFNSEVVYASRASFVVLLIEVADFCFNKPTRSTNFNVFGQRTSALLVHGPQRS